jgi:hypothetical protein
MLFHAAHRHRSFGLNEGLLAEWRGDCLSVRDCSTILKIGRLASKWIANEVVTGGWWVAYPLTRQWQRERVPLASQTPNGRSPRQPPGGIQHMNQTSGTLIRDGEAASEER